MLSLQRYVNDLIPSGLTDEIVNTFMNINQTV